MISVCVATYNGERFVEEQLRSILPQLGEEDEVIVSDDESTDSTLAIVESLGDKRIRVIHSTAHYFKWNFHNALDAAKGDILFLADQDDVWLPGKVEKCLSALEDADLVVHDSRVVDDDLKEIYPSFFRFYGSGKGLLKNALNNTYFGSCMAFRRSVWEAAQPFPESNEIGHDIWLGLVAEMTGRVHFLDEPLLLYRRHDLARTNLTQSLINRSKRSLVTKVWSRFVVLYHVAYFKLRKRNAEHIG